MKKFIITITLLITLVGSVFAVDYQSIFENSNGKVLANLEASEPFTTKEITVYMFEQKKSVKNGESFFITKEEYASLDGGQACLDFIEAAETLGSYQVFMFNYNTNIGTIYFVGDTQIGVLYFDLQ